MALVPDKEHAHLISKLLTQSYGLRQGESIVVSPTEVRPTNAAGSSHIEIEK